MTPRDGKVILAVAIRSSSCGPSAGSWLRVVAEDDAVGGEQRDVGHLGLERGDPDAPLAGRLDPDVAAEQAERVDGEVEGALQPDQVDGDPGARLRGGRGPGTLPVPLGVGCRPKSSEARLTPSAMVSTSMPSANPTSAMPMVGPWSESGPRLIGRLRSCAPAAAGFERERLGEALEVPAVRARRRPAGGSAHGRSTPARPAGFALAGPPQPRKVTVTLPGPNRSMVLVLFLSLKK